jgi:hypothetical protein
VGFPRRRLDSDQELAEELLLSAEADSEVELDSAAGAADSEAEADGSLAVGAAVFPLQAASISAATSAPRASLMFIRSIPRREARVV